MKTTVNQNRKTALQAQSRLSVSFSLRRSAALRRRAPLSASLTVEAALVLPLFLFVLLLFSVPFRIMTAERQMQRAAETVCDRAAALAALSTPEAAQYRNSLSALALAAARAAVSDPNLSGLSAERSSFLADGETVRVVLDYSYTLPIPLFRLPAIRCSRTAWRRAWIGETDPENCVAANPEEEIVYVGRHSTRYHKTARCHYLYNDLRAVSLSEATAARNASGGRYHACPVCARGASGGTVYLMPSGTAWHRDPACRAIRAYVRAVPKREVEQLGPCSYCYP